MHRHPPGAFRTTAGHSELSPMVLSTKPATGGNTAIRGKNGLVPRVRVLGCRRNASHTLSDSSSSLTLGRVQETGETRSVWGWQVAEVLLSLHAAAQGFLVLVQHQASPAAAHTPPLPPGSSSKGEARRNQHRQPAGRAITAQAAPERPSRAPPAAGAAPGDPGTRTRPGAAIGRAPVAVPRGPAAASLAGPAPWIRVSPPPAPQRGREARRAPGRAR